MTTLNNAGTHVPTLTLCTSHFQIGSWHPVHGLEVHTPSMVRTKGNNTMANITRRVTTILVTKTS